MFQEFSLSHVNFMLSGLVWTIGLAIIALTGGSIAGSVLALMAVSRNRIIRSIAQLYIFVVQGTPLLVTLFIAYFGANYVGFDVPPLVAISVAFSFYAAAFLGEIWRGSIQSVPRGQNEGAHALGLSRVDAMRYIIIPQAVKIATPANRGIFRDAHQEYIPCLSRQHYRVDADRSDREQRDIQAIAGLSAGCAVLFPCVLSADHREPKTGGSASQIMII